VGDIITGVDLGIFVSGHQALGPNYEPNFWLKFLVETRPQHKSSEPLIGHLTLKI